MLQSGRIEQDFFPLKCTMKPPPTSSARIRSIDVFGQASGVTGWTTQSVGLARALNRKVRVRFRTDHSLRWGELMGPLTIPLLRGAFQKHGDFSVLNAGTPEDPRRAARWVFWETTVLSETQLRFCATTEYLWTPSNWGRDNLIANGISPERIAVVPLGVDTRFFSPASKPHGRFRFLMVGKWEVRKNPIGLLRAFLDEFRADEDVELYLQTHNPYIDGFSVRTALEETGIGHVPNLILGQPCSQHQLRELYRLADCFVLPTRAEGWGLPILEAMACGIPAIVTRYSAPLDYVNDENGYLVNVARMVPAKDPVFHIDTGLWAEPDIEHLRALMRTAFKDHQLRKHKGAMARETAKRFSWDHAADTAIAAAARHLRRADGAQDDGPRRSSSD